MRCVGGDIYSGSCADRGGLATEREFKLALKQRERLLKIMAMRRRSSTSRHVHIDQAIAAGSFRPTDEDRVGVAGNGGVAHLGTVWIGDYQFAL